MSTLSLCCFEQSWTNLAELFFLLFRQMHRRRGRRGTRGSHGAIAEVLTMCTESMGNKECEGRKGCRRSNSSIAVEHSGCQVPIPSKGRCKPPLLFQPAQAALPLAQQHFRHRERRPHCCPLAVVFVMLWSVARCCNSSSVATRIFASFGWRRPAHDRNAGEEHCREYHSQ